MKREDLVERRLLERFGGGGDDLVLRRRSLGRRSRGGLLLLLRQLTDELAEVLRGVEVLLDGLGRVDGLAVSSIAETEVKAARADHELLGYLISADGTAVALADVEEDTTMAQSTAEIGDTLTSYSSVASLPAYWRMISAPPGCSCHVSYILARPANCRLPADGGSVSTHLDEVGHIVNVACPLAIHHTRLLARSRALRRGYLPRLAPPY